MWTKARDNIKALRAKLKLETDEEVKAKLMRGIEDWKSCKDKWFEAYSSRIC